MNNSTNFFTCRPALGMLVILFGLGFFQTAQAQDPSATNGAKLEGTNTGNTGTVRSGNTSQAEQLTQPKNPALTGQGVINTPNPAGDAQQRATGQKPPGYDRVPGTGSGYDVVPSSGRSTGSSTQSTELNRGNESSQYQKPPRPASQQYGPPPTNPNGTAGSRSQYDTPPNANPRSGTNPNTRTANQYDTPPDRKSGGSNGTPKSTAGSQTGQYQTLPIAPKTPGYDRVPPQKTNNGSQTGQYQTLPIAPANPGYDRVPSNGQYQTLPMKPASGNNTAGTTELRRNSESTQLQRPASGNNAPPAGNNQYDVVKPRGNTGGGYESASQPIGNKTPPPGTPANQYDVVKPKGNNGNYESATKPLGKVNQPAGQTQTVGNAGSKTAPPTIGQQGSKGKVPTIAAPQKPNNGTKPLNNKAKSQTIRKGKF